MRLKPMKATKKAEGITIGLFAFGLREEMLQPA
jgi:hypothetical protein